MTHRKKISIIFLIFFFFMFIFKIIAKDYTVVITESLPRGIYKLSNIDEIKVGDIVQFSLDKEEMEKIYSRGYLPRYAKTLIKEVAADYSNREEIEIREENSLKNLYIAKKSYSLILNKDSNGRELIALDIENLKPKNKDEFLLLSSHYKSYDGRYFGLVSRDKILKKAELKIKF